MDVRLHTEWDEGIYGTSWIGSGREVCRDGRFWSVRGNIFVVQQRMPILMRRVYCRAVKLTLLVLYTPFEQWIGKVIHLLRGEHLDGDVSKHNCTVSHARASFTHSELCHPSGLFDDCHQTWRYNRYITGAYIEERRAFLRI